MNDDGRWLINKIEIRSFLGVGPDGITVDLSHPVTVLEGPSGSGKSTIVSAIEWALFGSVANSPDYSVSGVGGNNASTHRALIHSGQNQASVKLEFESQGGQLSWVRTPDRMKT
jgi:DNA repair exonuclease SbcCD ATPase subunit